MYKKSLIFLAVVFILLNVWTLKDGHNWGGDFAQYIRHGQNIAEGVSYADRIELDKRSVSPPGFPLILAPLLKIFGLNFIALKSLNIFFWFGFVFLGYLLMKEELKPDFAFLGTVVFLSSPAFFTFKQNVLTDIPFVFFVTAAMYCFMRFVRQSRTKEEGDGFLYAALLCMGYAFLIRWAGVLLFIAAVLYVLLTKGVPKRKAILGLGGVFLVCVVIQSAFGSSVFYHAEELDVPVSVYLPMLFKQPSIVFNQILEFFFPRLTLPAVPFVHVLKWILTVAGPVILIVILWHAFKNRRTLSFPRWFFSLYLPAITFWVLFSSWRYVLPVVLLVVLISVKDYCAFIERFRPRTKTVLENIMKAFLVLIIFNNMVILVLQFDFNDDMIYVPETRQMTEWVRHHLGEDEHFMFSKPRVVGLLTGRMGTSYYYLKQGAVVCDRVERFDISYVITTAQVAEDIDRDFDLCSYTYERAWRNDVYQIFKIVRPVN